MTTIPGLPYFNARCGAMKGSLGNAVTEDKGKRDMDEIDGNDTFVETGYEDEPDVLETEVKHALRHIKQ